MGMMINRRRYGHGKVLLNNIIIYEASEKLPETTANNSTGLKTNAFNTTIVQHSFENGVGTIEFADDVTSIGWYAFCRCSNMTSINIPNTITLIGGLAFFYCVGLVTINSKNTGEYKLPDGITSINNQCFRACTELKYIEIPSGVSVIDYGLFREAGLLDAILPSSVTSIDSYALASPSLLSLTVKATTPPTLGSYGPIQNNANLVIYVPAESVEAYKTAWSNYANKIQAIST